MQLALILVWNQTPNLDNSNGFLKRLILKKPIEYILIAGCK
jgi:hypothetical protein